MALKEISPQWEKVIKFAKILNYGRFEIILQNGEPVRLEHIVQQIKLDDEFENEIRVIPLI